MVLNESSMMNIQGSENVFPCEKEVANQIYANQPIKLKKERICMIFNQLNQIQIRFKLSDYASLIFSHARKSFYDSIGEVAIHLQALTK